MGLSLNLIIAPKGRCENFYNCPQFAHCYYNATTAISNFYWKQQKQFRIRLRLHLLPPTTYILSTYSLSQNTNESPALSVSPLLLTLISSNSTNAYNKFIIFKNIQHEIYHICKQKLLHNFNLIKLLFDFYLCQIEDYKTIHMM